jgi:branched-chain amino acid transport system substrate-binding protein
MRPGKPNAWWALVIGVAAAVLAQAAGAAAQPKGEIRIGFLAPLTGVLAQAAQDTVNAFRMYWEEVGSQAAGRPVRVIVADTACNPDNAITQTRRLMAQEKVHLIVGPLCSHEGPAVAKATQEAGLPVLMHVAAADAQTKWNRTENVVRTGGSGSQYTHPLGHYAYHEAGCRKVTSMATDYTFGQENMLGALAGYRAEGGEVLRSIWFPLGTKDFGPVLAGIPAETDCVLATAVGAEAPRLLEAWFDFGYSKKLKILGGWWLVEDVLPTMDRRAVGLIGASHAYFSGLPTPESQAFVTAFARRHKRLPGWYAETSYTTALWTKTAIEAANGNVEDGKALLDAVRKVQVRGPRGPVRLDPFDNPIQNIYIAQVREVEHPVLGKVLMPVPVKTYENVSQFWKWSPEEFLKRGPYKR